MEGSSSNISKLGAGNLWERLAQEELKPPAAPPSSSTASSTADGASSAGAPGRDASGVAARLKAMLGGVDGQDSASSPTSAGSAVPTGASASNASKPSAAARAAFLSGAATTVSAVSATPVAAPAATPTSTTTPAASSTSSTKDVDGTGARTDGELLASGLPPSQHPQQPQQPQQQQQQQRQQQSLTRAVHSQRGAPALGRLNPSRASAPPLEYLTQRQIIEARKAKKAGRHRIDGHPFVATTRTRQSSLISSPAGNPVPTTHGIAPHSQGAIYRASDHVRAGVVRASQQRER